jgi:single-stranded-DNA-specific exonuclease
MPGMTLKEENYSLFKEAFENKYRKQSIRTCYLEIDIDAEINFADITPKLTRILNSLSLSPLNMTLCS